MSATTTTTFTLLHRAMRADSARLAAAVAELREADREPRGRALVHWYGGFRAELVAHHQLEDEVLMPALRARVPELTSRVERVEIDHRHLDDVLERVRVKLDRLADATVPFGPARAAARGATGELRALLQHHLDFEDGVLVALFAEHFSLEEYDALDAQGGRLMRMGTLTFTVPWIMDNADPDDRQRLLTGAPLAFKVMWYATRGRYERLVATAFGL